MTFQEFKQTQNALEVNVNTQKQALKEFDTQRLSNGLVPNQVRKTQEYINAKNNFDKAFNKLRNFNGTYLPKFKKELLAERRAKFN